MTKNIGILYCRIVHILHILFYLKEYVQVVVLSFGKIKDNIMMIIQVKLSIIYLNRS